MPGVELVLKGSTIETLTAYGQEILRALENANANAEISREHAERSVDSYGRITDETRRPEPPARNRVVALANRIGDAVLARRERERTEGHRYTQDLHERAAAMLECGLAATIKRLERELAASENAPQILNQLRAQDAYPDTTYAIA